MKRCLRSLALLLIVVQLLPYMSVYATHVEKTQISPTFKIADSTGMLMEFREMKDEEGNTTLQYFEDGNLRKTYTISPNSPVIVVSCENEADYQFPMKAQLTTAPIIEENSRDLTTRNLGVFYYNPVSTFVNPHINVACTTTHSEKSTYRVITEAEASFSDKVAELTAVIIGSALTTVVISTGPASVIAAGVLTAMISAAGGKITGGLISIALSDSYNSVILHYKLTATFYDPSMSSSYVKYYTGGTAEYVAYDGRNYSDIYYSGCNPQESYWNNNLFAAQAWADTVMARTGITCPGVSRVVVNDPS